MLTGGVYILAMTVIYTCNGPSHEQPISNEVLVCKMNGTNDVRVDSADR